MDLTTAVDPEYAYESRSDDEYEEDAPPVRTKAEAAAQRREERRGANQAVRQQANKDRVVKRARGECYVEPTDQLIDKQKGTLPVIKIKQAPHYVKKIKPAQPREEPRLIRKRLAPMEVYRMGEEESDAGDGASVPPRHDAVKLRLARGSQEDLREWVLRESGAPR